MTGVWVSPGKGEEILGRWVEGDGKEGVFEVEDGKMGGRRRDL